MLNTKLLSVEGCGVHLQLVAVALALVSGAVVFLITSGPGRKILDATLNVSSAEILIVI